MQTWHIKLLQLVLCASALVTPLWSATAEQEFNNATREEVTACLAEIRAFHAIYYPYIRQRSDKTWADWVAKGERYAYKLRLHKEVRDKILAAENDLYLFAMEDSVGGGDLRVSLGKSRILRSIKYEEEYIQKPRSPDDPIRARANICLAQARLNIMYGNNSAATQPSSATTTTVPAESAREQSSPSTTQRESDQASENTEMNHESGAQQSQHATEESTANSANSLTNTLSPGHSGLDINANNVFTIGENPGDATQPENTTEPQTRAEPRAHVAEAEASDCLTLDTNNLYGGFINACNFPVVFRYCAYRPAPGAWTEAFNCEEDKWGLDHVGARQSVGAHTKGAEQIHWVACRITNPDGSDLNVSPVSEWDASSKQIRFRCREAGAD